ncbi:probable LRR receptor-like serine/threonine-protein kinase At3g47570 [Malus sylvestris]|uniref:probable LRR receptor-like serine/threonine-protein kinase At3g47570 n=1 Tax=Malus sylvestris TaxID=3752 RepID=UPI0021AC5876|nr:probable LRR receptor-like serine/threonine-protein kinase At3g47570 [Malus sylvestris]
MNSHIAVTLLSVLACIFLSVDSAFTPSNVTDKEALISFQSTANLPPFLWNQSSSPCTNWTGVACNRIGGTQRVVSLDLSGFGLTGSISHHVGSLTELQVLNLARNNLSGPIPPSISNLSSTLTSLNLGTNSLTGIIPMELGFLRKLKELDLAGNQLTGTVALSIYNISSLVRFTVASNQLWGEIPSNIGVTLPNLLYFRNCFNLFTGKIPASLHNITKIRELRLSNNFHDGSVPPGLGNLPFLEMYNIGFNRIVSYGDNGLDFITSLTNSSRLSWLAIDENRLEGLIPESIGNLSKVLSKLYMGGNRIYGNIPASISQLSSLTLLNVSYNSISGEIPSEIGQLKELQVLGLARNKLSGTIPNSLGNMMKLNRIDLSGNYFVGHIPLSFSNFQKLLSMDLSDNSLNGSISGEIFLNLPSLSTILNLSNNLLSGPLPEEIGVLANVVTIDLSNNGLSGSIPSSIGKCTSLERLFIARNNLSGPLPNALGEIRGLEILDLSSNKLSGFIPDKLQELQVLSFLNLSFNSLEGVIPNGGVFVRNISSVYLEGNWKLCRDWPCVKSGGQRRKVLVLVLIITSVLAALVGIVVIGWLLCVRKRKGLGCKTTLRETSPDLLIKGQHQLVTYEELRSATGNFNPENLVGSGSFGTVYRGFLRQGTEVAVKVLDIKMTGSWKSFLAECEALRNVRHRNLVKLITSCSRVDFKNMEFLALIYEYLSNGSLEDWIKGNKKKADGDGLNILERLNVAIDVACGLDYLHHDCEVPVVHCDLKPSNILLDGDMTAKIGDFGLAKLLMERTEITQHSLSSTNVLKGSIGYIPPEYGFGQKPSTAGDAYSFGVMLLELFTGKSPTDESFTGDENLIRWVQSAIPHNMIKVLDPELLDLMHCLPNEGPYLIPAEEHNCLVLIFEVGLSCTCVSPDGRSSLREALYKLETARQTLFKVESVNCQALT